MKIHEDKDATLWECDAEGCCAQASNEYLSMGQRGVPYDWAEIRRHDSIYHFCFSHGIDLFRSITLKERL